MKKFIVLSVLSLAALTAQNANAQAPIPTPAPAFWVVAGCSNDDNSVILGGSLSSAQRPSVRSIETNGAATIFSGGMYVAVKSGSSYRYLPNISENLYLIWNTNIPSSTFIPTGGLSASFGVPLASADPTRKFMVFPNANVAGLGTVKLTCQFNPQF